MDPIVSSMLYAMDRYYNMPMIEEKRKKGFIILLDRYTYSTMAHQGGKILEKEKNFSYLLGRPLYIRLDDKSINFI